MSEIKDLQQRPQSMLNPTVQQTLIRLINGEIEKAIKQGQDELASEFARAKKLVKKGCWSVRKANPFLEHMSECLNGKGGDLKATQEAMQECSIKWNELPPEKKRGKREDLAIYDYL